MVSKYLYKNFWRCHRKSVSPSETASMKHQPFSPSGNHFLLFLSLNLTCFEMIPLSHASGITECPFLVLFVSLNLMTIRFIHIVALSELPTFKG